jgi:Ser/Thr protein kinase RdoA (MazF antagonist)
VNADEEGRAVEAATRLARDAGLGVDEVVVITSSNKLALRLLPADVFARVAPLAHDHAAFELPLALRLIDAGGPVAAPDPRVEPTGHRRDGWEVSFWTYHPPVAPRPEPDAYADGLARLHAGMRTVDAATPRFTDRVAEAEEIVGDGERSPGLVDVDRRLLLDALRRLRAAVLAHDAPEQLLHGEPHPGNVLATAAGPVFVDLETCCRGPVAFDLAHVPEAVADRYPGLDAPLLDDCRGLVLAMVAGWRADRHDQLPDGARFGRDLLAALRAGPPWPTLDALFG